MNFDTAEMVGEVVVPPSKKLDDLIRLAELCVDLLRQNEEFYAEVSHTNNLKSLLFQLLFFVNLVSHICKVLLSTTPKFNSPPKSRSDQYHTVQN